MKTLKNITYTIEDIYALPDGERAELIDGIIYNMAPPNFKHQIISGILHGEIYNYIKKKKENCIVVSAPFAVFLNQNNKTYVEPDISVICDKNKLTEKGCNGAPDWIIEIVSPSTRENDYGIKLFKYCNAGVREYWIVDPIKNRIMVYIFDNKTSMNEYTFADKIKVGIYDDLEIDFSEIAID
ncbi:MAG: Uma2 family endonuclease [Lachnospiraceae bacterium]|nr:Uma2 family endonuclease [Lachnospiraceae bacterium]